MKFGKIKKLHFVGIGGIGMCGIAEVLHNQGYAVTGSDMALTEVTEHLQQLGIKVYEGHRTENVNNADCVVISSAVHEDNPEIIEARRRKIPVIRRAEMLGELMRLKFGIGVAGTHGKTTTTSMLGHIFVEAGLDPTVMVGGRVISFQTTVKLGQGDLLIAEADEYDRSFLSLTPSVAVLTTLEADHLDYYKDLDEIKVAFTQFANKVPFYGTIHLNLDESNLVSLIPHLIRPIRTFGLKSQADLRADNVHQEGTTIRFSVYHHNRHLGDIALPRPGVFNVKNALAAISVALESDIPFATIKKALENFRGVNRRFDLIGEKNGIKVYDDYAHHPTEIEVTLQAARIAFKHRLIVIFQPHLFSRTKDFYEEFAKSLLTCDMLILAKIYPAREQPIPGVTARMISDASASFGHKNVQYVEDVAQIPGIVAKYAQSGDVVFTIGAGDIYRTAPKILEAIGR
ncbi:MAG: UDP-N-acetylmuramate--L-alanine ligase [candidate division Zixibacteria bacterium]|nr:UDP-N-acetylmuramate--L-alanine ligase [candidate division Zixibacteria bacterium]